MDEPQQKPDDPFAPNFPRETVSDSEEMFEEARDAGARSAAEGALHGDAATADDLPWIFDERESDREAPILDMPQDDRSAPRPRRGPGLAGHLVSVIGGGILGLAVGYWLLNWLGGSRFDLLGVPLPGVPHTHGGAPPGDAADEAVHAIEVPIAPAPDQEIDRAEPETRTVDHPPRAELDAPFSWPPPQETEPVESAQPPLPEGYVGPRDFSTYRLDDLTQAIAAAGAAAACAQCRGTGFVTEIGPSPSGGLEGHRIVQQTSHRVRCDQCVGHSALTMTADVYERFCRLAEVATFVRIDPGEAELGETKEVLRLVLLRSAQTQQNLNTIGRLAGRQLEAADGHGAGILLAGTVHETASQGKLHLVRIVLFGFPKVVTVASARGSILQPKDRVVILGTVVRRPGENLIGYAGRLPVVIWGGMPVRLPPSAR